VFVRENGLVVIEEETALVDEMAKDQRGREEIFGGSGQWSRTRTQVNGDTER